MESLVDHFLIAMPSLKDPYFKQAVTYIFEHSQEGAMGLVINQPLELKLSDLLIQAEIEHEPNQLKTEYVFAGGPVQTDRGFVLHTPQPDRWRNSLQINEQIMVTSSKDILKSLATPEQPEQYLVVLGYAGWSENQLEQEVADNSWLTTMADSHLIFDAPAHERWQVAGQGVGIHDIWQVSGQIGHA